MTGAAVPRRRPWIPLLLLGIPTCIVAAFIYFQFTSVSGLELNTNNWNIREFSFRRDPFTNRQLSGRTYSSAARQSGWARDADRQYSQIDPAIRRYLQVAPDARWDLVDIYQTPSSGEAKILIDLLGASDLSFQDFWPTWSTKNPRQAALLWPAAQVLVRFGLYTDLPELLRLALEAQAEDDYESRIKAYVQEAMEAHARQLATQGEGEAAERVQAAKLEFGTFLPVARVDQAAADAPSSPTASSPDAAEVSEEAQFVTPGDAQQQDPS